MCALHRASSRAKMAAPYVLAGQENLQPPTTIKSKNNVRNKFCNGIFSGISIFDTEFN